MGAEMTDMKIGSEQLSREYALRILTSKPDEAGHQKSSSLSGLIGFSSDPVLEAANAQVIRILIDALGDADVSVSAGEAQAGATTGAGNDTISVTAGSVDLVSSSEGNDSIAIKTSGRYDLLGEWLLSSVDRVEAGAGDDAISISSHGSVTRIYGDAGSDDIKISSTVTSKIGAGLHGIDNVDGGDGDDTVTLTSSSNVGRVFEGGGKDSIVIDARESVSGIYGDDGNDAIVANAGHVSGLYGGSGSDTITIKAQSAHGVYGGEGDDTIVVDTEESVSGVYGGDGNDVIRIKTNALGLVQGGTGDDHLILESIRGERNTVYFSEGDGHDIVETNKPLEIKRFKPDGTDVAENDATIRRNDDGTVTIEFPGGRDSIKVKFTNGLPASDIVLEQLNGRLTVSQRS